MAGALCTEVDVKDETNRCTFCLLIAKIFKWKFLFYYRLFIYCSFSIFETIFRFI